MQQRMNNMALKQICMIGGLNEVKDIIHNNHVSSVHNPASHDQVVTPSPPQGPRATYAQIVQARPPRQQKPTNNKDPWLRAALLQKFHTLQTVLVIM